MYHLNTIGYRMYLIIIIIQRDQLYFFFFFNDPPTTEISPLPLHAALPIFHIAPDGFVRIRHFGLLANRRRAAALAQCRVLLMQPPVPPASPESVRELMLRVTGTDIARCPVCQQGVLHQVEVLPPAPATWDTS